MEHLVSQVYLDIRVLEFLGFLALVEFLATQAFLVVAALVDLVALLRAWFMIHLLQLHHKQHLQLH